MAGGAFSSTRLLRTRNCWRKTPCSTLRRSVIFIVPPLSAPGQSKQGAMPQGALRVALAIRVAQAFREGDRDRATLSATVAGMVRNRRFVGGMPFVLSRGMGV